MGLGYTKFAIQFTDAYEYVPQDNEYHSGVEMLGWMARTLDENRKSAWGMIHCTH
jgi:hypothetical protein